MIFRFMIKIWFLRTSLIRIFAKNCKIVISILQFRWWFRIKVASFKNFKLKCQIATTWELMNLFQESKSRNLKLPFTENNLSCPYPCDVCIYFKRKTSVFFCPKIQDLQFWYWAVHYLEYTILKCHRRAYLPNMSKK